MGFLSGAAESSQGGRLRQNQIIFEFQPVVIFHTISHTLRIFNLSLRLPFRSTAYLVLAFRQLPVRPLCGGPSDDTGPALSLDPLDLAESLPPLRAP